MLDGVVECLVKKERTFGAKLVRITAILIDVIVAGISLLILLYLTSYVAFVCVLAGACWFITWLAFRYTSVEYEYSYFEGDFIVDKIYNKSKRKRLKKINFSKVERIAPADSPIFENIGSNDRKTYDYSTLNPEDQSYAMLVAQDDGTTAVVAFTPNEELLEVLKRKYSRKFY